MDILATVVAASCVAIATVSVMRLGSYELVHRTYVMGSVGHSEAMVVSYYGLFAPTDQRVTVQLPEGQGYIAPFNDPSALSSPSFADPQTYTLDNGSQTAEEDGRSVSRPHSLSFPARTTLKKLQVRWYGSLATQQNFGSLDGQISRNPAVGPNDPEALDAHPLAGVLRNRTRYTLQDVMVIAYVDSQDIRYARIYDLKSDWKPGADITLERDLVERLIDRTGDGAAAGYPAYGRRMVVRQRQRRRRSIRGQQQPAGVGKRVADRQKNPADFLSWLLNIRSAESPTADRVGLSREFTQSIDRSATLRAAHVLILAVAKSDHQSDASKATVPAVLPLTVDGTKLEGDGDISFVWSADLP